jgi:hypothetical protein
MMVWELISVGSYFPHFLPYTNEFILQKKNAYKIIADTNLCYREGRRYLNEYLATHRDAVYRPKGPVSGLAVVEINDFLGIQEDSIDSTYQWLKGYEPEDHIHSQYLIFNIHNTFLVQIRSTLWPFFTLFGIHFLVTYIPRLIITTMNSHKVHRGKIGFNTLLIGSNSKAVEALQEVMGQKRGNGNKFIGFVSVNKDTENVLEK